MTSVHTRTFRGLRSTIGAAGAIVALGCLIGACASSGTRKRAEREPKPTPSQAPASTPAATMGPRTPEAQELQVPKGANGEAPAPAPALKAAAPDTTPEASRPAPSTASRTPDGSREDGRPNWWFAAPRRSDGRVQLCAEALGVDMAASRDAALQTARARMRRELGLNESAAIRDEQIERAWVWPLPNSRVGPSRYAGYVLISASPVGAD